MEIHTIMKLTIECMELICSGITGLRSSLIASNHGSAVPGIEEYDNLVLLRYKDTYNLPVCI